MAAQRLELAFWSCRGFFREYNRINSQVADGTLFSMYPSLHHRVIAPRKSPLVRFEIDEGELKAFYGTDHVAIEDDEAEEFARLPNQEKMYYKIGACQKLMEDSGETFDLVIRMRPDRQVYNDSRPDWHQALASSQSNNMIFDDFGKCQHAHHNVNMGDQFAVGTPELMGCYANSFRFVQETKGQGLYLMSNEYKEHVTLALSLFYHQVDVEQLPNVRFGDLMLPPALSPRQMEEIILFDCAGTPRNWIDEALLAACREDAKIVAGA